MASPEHAEAIEQALMDDAKIEAALEQAEREVMLRHKKLAQPLVVWRDGRVVQISSDEIDVEGNGTKEKEKRS